MMDEETNRTHNWKRCIVTKFDLFIWKMKMTFYIFYEKVVQVASYHGPRVDLARRILCFENMIPIGYDETMFEKKQPDPEVAVSL